jgi:hypothetical protein
LNNPRTKLLFLFGVNICYCCGKLESPKGCEIQTIYAIMKEIRAVTGMARFPQLVADDFFLYSIFKVSATYTLFQTEIVTPFLKPTKPLPDLLIPAPFWRKIQPFFS